MAYYAGSPYAGSIECLQGGPKYSKPKASKDTSPKPKKEAPPKLVMTLKVDAGRGLVSRDSNGLSDPYVKMFITGPWKGLVPAKLEKGKKTSVVKKSLNPEWNEELVLKIDEGLVKSNFDIMLNVEIWDKDTFGHDSMGRLPPISVKKMMLGQFDRHNFPWLEGLTDVPQPFNSPVWAKVGASEKGAGKEGVADVSGDLKVTLGYKIQKGEK